MSDPMRHRNATPPYGASVTASAGTEDVTDPGTPDPSPMSGSLGAVPAVEADAQDSRVIEQQLIEQEGWHELIELLLNRSERVQGAERIETLRQVAAIFEGRIGNPQGAFATLDTAHREDPTNEPIFDDLVRLSAALGRLDAMEAVARRALGALPRHEKALLVLETLARGAERWDELAQLLSQHVALTADTPEATVEILHELATISEVHLGDAGRAARAWEDLLRVSQDAATNHEAVEALERLYESTDDVEGYLGILERKVESVQSDAEFVAIHQMMAALWEGRMEKPLRACQALEKILGVHPTDAHVHRELERLYRQEEQWHELAHLYERQIAGATAADERAELTFRMAEIWDRLGDVEKAVQSYRNVVAIVPDHAEALSALARLSELVGDIDEAFEATQKRLLTLTDEKEKAALNHRMGVMALEHLKDPAEAEGRWRAALELEPKRVETLRALLQLYRSREQWKSAAEVLARAVEVSAEGTEKVGLLIEAAALHHDRLGDDEKAYDLYAKALDLEPQNAAACSGMVEVALALEEWGAVVRFAEILLKPVGRGETRPQVSKLDAARLHLTLAKAAQQLGEAVKAAFHYKKASELDAGVLPELSAWANLLWEKKEWRGAAALYDMLHGRADAGQSPADKLEVTYRLGRARLELCERRLATEVLQKALQLDPRHRPTLEAMARVRFELEDHRGAVAAKTTLVELVDTADERYTLLCEIGAILRDRLRDREEALQAFRRALECRPDDHRTLHAVLELHTAGRHWSDAVAVIRRLAATATDAKVQARYLVAAGNIINHELGRPVDALEAYEEALDLDPDDVKTWRRIEGVLTERRDWQALELASLRMIHRPGDATDPSRRAMLADQWRALGLLYRARLHREPDAVAAFRNAEALEDAPANGAQAPQRGKEALAAPATDPNRPGSPLPASVQAGQQNGSGSPVAAGPAELAVELRALYASAVANGQSERALACAAALVATGQATPEEDAVAQQGRRAALQPFARAITDDLWEQHLVRPDQDRRISAIFAVVSHATAFVRARSRKELGLPRERHDLRDDVTMFGRVATIASAALQIPCPELVLQPDQPGDVDLICQRDKDRVTPILCIRSGLLGARPDTEIAFIVARHLTLMRPELFVLWPNVIPIAEERKAALIAAGRLVQPALAAPPHLAEATGKYVELFKAVVPREAARTIQDKAPPLFLENPEPDVARWSRAAELSADRAGLLVCRDLAGACRAISAQPLGPGRPTTEERIDNLVRWSVSDDRFALAARAG
jgi:tetratricopeptide (TPR) repeat protein